MSIFENNFDSFLEVDNFPPTEGPILMIDGGNWVYRNVFASVYCSPEDNGEFFLWRHFMLNSLLETIKFNDPSQVIVALDSKNLWRRDIFSDYKSNRKSLRDKAVVDFDKFFPILDEFKKDLTQTFTKIRFLEVEKCEADDVIAVLTKEVFKDKRVIIISSDRDLTQLLNSKVTQYDPNAKKMVNCLNPKMDLEVKIITGDRGDAIPAIKKRTGEVTARAIINNGLDDYLNNPDNSLIKEAYIRNRTLIDFDFIPRNYIDSIINKYNQYDLKDIQSLKLMKFFSKNRLMKLMSEWETFSSYIKKLK